MFIATTKTDLAKLVVQMVVAMQVTKQAEHALVNNTNLDPDGIPIKVVAVVAGQLAAQSAAPATDAAVDYSIAKFASWKNRKNTKTAE